MPSPAAGRTPTTCSREADGLYREPRSAFFSTTSDAFSGLGTTRSPMWT